ncbi:MAG: LPS export ABC transporter ATP-binding protein [Limnochordaceae bacterium]|nr:LPS export ABC transporter ATP-binding protein [Limnochordaceae bacterium]
MNGTVAVSTAPDGQRGQEVRLGPEPQRRFARTLRAEALHKRYGGRPVVADVWLRVETGEVVGLLGPNGAGKTTTFAMLVGLDRPDSGKVVWCEQENGREREQDATRWPMHRRARLGICYLPQEPSVFRRLTVEQNIQAVLELQRLSRAQREQRLNQLLATFRLDGLRHQRAHSLSGGERRRTELARALAASPSILLLDEPFTGVDPIAVAELQDMIRHLKEMGLGILITDHNVRETLAICDRAYIMYDGHILVEGTPEQLADDPRARQFYLGEGFRL